MQTEWDKIIADYCEKKFGMPRYIDRYVSKPKYEGNIRMFFRCMRKYSNAYRTYVWNVGYFGKKYGGVKDGGHREVLGSETIVVRDPNILSAVQELGKRINNK